MSRTKQSDGTRNLLLAKDRDVTERVRLHVNQHNIKRVVPPATDAGSLGCIRVVYTEPEFREGGKSEMSNGAQDGHFYAMRTLDRVHLSPGPDQFGVCHAYCNRRIIKNQKTGDSVAEISLQKPAKPQGWNGPLCPKCFSKAPAFGLAYQNAGKDS